MTVRFDYRLSPDALAAELKKYWPEMLRRGAVRRPSRLTERSLALLHFVCLELLPGMTWRQRMEAWNDSHSEWRHQHAQDFQGKFHRAEEAFIETMATCYDEVLASVHTLASSSGFDDDELRLLLRDTATSADSSATVPKC